MLAVHLYLKVTEDGTSSGQVVALVDNTGGANEEMKRANANNVATPLEAVLDGNVQDTSSPVNYMHMYFFFFL
jgi:hypothetical protein